MKLCKFLLTGAILALFVTCDRTGDSFLVGDVFTDNRAVLGYIDSFSLQLSTIRLDSFVTSGVNDIFLGYCKDEKVGNVLTEVYLPINFAVKTNIPEDAEYDSLIICFKPKGGWVGDTLQPKVVNVYEVLEEIKPRYNAEIQQMFNHQSLKHSDSELATIKLEPNPKVGLVSWARMSDSLGRIWFNKLVNADDVMDNNIYFEQYFKGLCLIPQTTDFLWGLNFVGNDEAAYLSTERQVEDAKQFEIRLYYHKSGDDEDGSYTSFIIKEGAYQYTHFVNDRSGTAFENLAIDGDKVPAGNSGHLSYIQTCSGMVLRIDFPTLASLRSASEYMSIIDARLIIKPREYSYDDINYRLPLELHLALTDESNDLFGYLTDIYGNAVSSPVYYYTEEDQPFYTFSILPFVRSFLTNQIENSMSIIVLTSNLDNSTDFRRLVVDDNSEFGENVQLQIYYVTY